MSTLLQPKEIILSICEPREFLGREAHSRLNRISKALHEAILNNCSLFEKPKLIPIFYNMFDESCYNFLKFEHFASNDLSQIYRVEKAPTIFRYLLETAILSTEIQQNQEITRQNVLSFILGAQVFMEACVHSDYLYRNDFAGGFSISELGDITFQTSEKFRKSEQDYVWKMSLLSEKMKPDVTQLELDVVGNIKRVSLQEDAIPYDALFRQTYGLNLSTIVGTAESVVFDICRRVHGVEIIPQSDLLKKIRRNTSYDKHAIKKALQFLRIDKSMLSNEYQYYRLNDAPVSVSRRPIIHLFEGSGEKGDVVYLGRNALFRAILLLFADIDRGIIELGDVADRWAKEKGPEFEENVRLALSKRGFRVIRVTNPPSDVGEIDAVAYHEQKQSLLIVEAKAPKLDLAMDKAKWHFERSRKWCLKHDKKVRWARENSQELVSRLNLPETRIEEVTGVIVTKVPWYIEPGLPYMILSFEEFERLLDHICSA